MVNIEREIDKLSAPFDEIPNESLQPGGKSESELARQWVYYDRPDFTAYYLKRATDLSKADKINILADAFKETSKHQATLAQTLIESTGTDAGFLEQARINLKKATDLRENLAS